VKNLNRRGFFRMVGACGKAAGAALFLDACAKVGIQVPPVETATQIPGSISPTISDTALVSPSAETIVPSSTTSPLPVSTSAGDISKIALVKTIDRREGVRQALDLLGINPVQGRRIFLKANYNSADPTPGSTHPDVLKELGAWLNEKGALSITLGDRSGMGITRQVFQERGVFDIAQELGMQVIVFDDLGADGWVKFNPQGSHWQRGFLFSRACLEADAIIQTCCVKTHQYGGHFTLSIKNSVGLVAKFDPADGYNYMNELHTSDNQRKMIAEINTVYAPALIVMDGVEAFVTGGPATGKKVQPGVILAGTDRVVMDAVGVAILRYFGATAPVMKVELGLGIDSPQKISFVTGDESSAGFAEELQQILLQG
jgi:uncharacterized protein (DUF362 family)